MKRPGFTLVELLVYLGITSIALVVFMNFMVGIFANARRADASQQMSENGRLIMAKITQASRSASNIDGLSVFNTTLGKVVLAKPTVPVTYDTYDVDGAGKFRENTIPITPNDIKITKFFIPTPIGNNYSITLQIESTAPESGRPKPLILETSFTPRQAIYQ